MRYVAEEVFLWLEPESLAATLCSLYGTIIPRLPQELSCSVSSMLMWRNEWRPYSSATHCLCLQVPRDLLNRAGSTRKV
jgi:hypothetical protein